MAGALLHGHHGQNAVGANVKGNFDRGHMCLGGWNTFQDKFAQEMILLRLRRFTLTLGTSRAQEGVNLL